MVLSGARHLSILADRPACIANGAGLPANVGT
jgi:hypothetical protein